MSIEDFISKAASRVMAEVLTFFAGLASPVRLAPQQIDRLRDRVRAVLRELLGVVDGGGVERYEQEQVMEALKTLETGLTQIRDAVLRDSAWPQLSRDQKRALQERLASALVDAAKVGQRYQAAVDKAKVTGRPKPPPLPKVVVEPGPWDDDATTKPSKPARR